MNQLRNGYSMILQAYFEHASRVYISNLISSLEQHLLHVLLKA